MSRTSTGTATNASGGGGGGGGSVTQGTVPWIISGDVNLTEVGGAAFSLGQQLAAASLPVVLTASQLSTLTPLPTVAVTQSTSPWVVSLSSTTITGTVAVTQSTSPWTVAGGGTAGSAATEVITIQGIASMTPVQVSQATGTNLHMVVDSGTITTVSSVTAVGTITPGTGATNLGKAEDAGHTSGDVGVMALGVRNDALASATTTDLDYTFLATRASGVLASAPVGDYAAGADAIANSGPGLQDFFGNPTYPRTWNMFYNGSTWDRFRGDTTNGLDVDITRIAAGTNNIGQVSVAPQTANGLSVFNATSSDGASALTNSAQAIKASAGNLYGWYIYNPNSIAQFVQLYNTAAASVTVGTTSPLFMLTIPPQAAANVEFTNGITFSNAGWSAAATSTAGGNGAPTTSLDAVFYYK